MRSIHQRLLWTFCGSWRTSPPYHHLGVLSLEAIFTSSKLRAVYNERTGNTHRNNRMALKNPAAGQVTTAKFMNDDTDIRKRRTTMRKVAGIRRPIFPHKRYLDGTIQSICGECFSTIAFAGVERELRIAEDAHVCKGLKFSRVLRPLDRN